MKHYLPAENAVDNPDAMYDIALKEYNYYEGDEVPFGGHPPEKGRMMGDIDVGLVDIENQVLYAKEIKTSYNQTYKADKQLDRIEEHFGEHGWDVIKNKVLEL
jgi:hypothetical protein